ncbi:MAG: hypothetical protein NT129_02695 [Candidatus Aenigmarchaeota archaeon]|nr:hypothetical protein [Candidatus Aenigmarchaeota archaeon]
MALKSLVYQDPQILGFELHQLPGDRYVAFVSIGGWISWAEFHLGARKTGRHDYEAGIEERENYKSFIVESLQASP